MSGHTGARGEEGQRGRRSGRGGERVGQHGGEGGFSTQVAFIEEELSACANHISLYRTDEWAWRVVRRTRKQLGAGADGAATALGGIPAASNGCKDGSGSSWEEERELWQDLIYKHGVLVTPGTTSAISG